MKRTLWLALITVAVLALLLGCAQPSPTPSPAPAPSPKAPPAPSPAPAPSPSPTAKAPATMPAGWDADISIGTKMMPSTTFMFGAATAQALNKYAKGYTARPMPFGSSVVFPENFQKKEADLGILEISTAFQAANAQLQWKEPMPVRILSPGAHFYAGVIANPKSGIKSAADLKGKKWMIIRPGSTLLKEMADAIMHGYGLTEKDVTILNHSSDKEFMDALKEGRVDAIGWPYYENSPWLQELTLLGKAVLLSDTPEAIKRISEKYPYFVRVTVPKGTYKGQDQEVVTFGSLNTVAVRDSLPVDQVYDMTSILFTNFNDWKSYFEDIKYHQLPGSVELGKLVVPFHEGAIKYYKEKGFWKAEHEAKQKALLDTIARIKK